jgi:predicted porin
LENIMKNYLRAVPLALVALYSAQAASQVTLGGIADVAIRHVENAGLASNTSMVSGANNTSRVFFRGTENLGSGMTAGFHLEMGIQYQSGAQASSTAGQLFDRRAVVSLASSAWGEVIAGRDYVPTYSLWVANDPFSHVGVAGSNNLASATPVGPIRSAFGSAFNTTVRANDSLQWLLPKNGLGLEGGLFTGFRANGQVADGKNDVMGFRLSRQFGDLRVSYAQLDTSNSLTTAGDFQDRVATLSYTVRGVRVVASNREFKYATAKQTNRLLGAYIPAPGGHQIKLSWLTADYAGTVGTASIGANDVEQIGVGYVYNLSRRSVLYVNASTITNKGAAATAIPGGAAGLAAGKDSRGFEAGIRHNF